MCVRDRLLINIVIVRDRLLINMVIVRDKLLIKIVIVRHRLLINTPYWAGWQATTEDRQRGRLSS